jgi:hypothetical protein
VIHSQHHPGRSVIAALLLIVTLCAPYTGAARTSAAPGIRIQLLRASFDPLDEQPALPAGLLAPALADDARSVQYALIQFRGPIQPTWREQATALGAELLDYIPDYAYVARLQPGAAPALRALPAVRWLGPFHPAYRLSPALDSALDSAAAESPATLDLQISIYPGEDVDALATTLAGLGAELLAHTSGPAGSTLQVRLPTAWLAAATRLSGVAWIGPATALHTNNDVARTITGVNATWQRVPGLYGQGQTIAIADTGLDTGDMDTLSADFAGRIASKEAFGDRGSWSDLTGHGTHVAGILLGSGVLSGSDPANHSYSQSYAGVAPEAYLVMQSIGDAEGGLGGLADVGIPMLLQKAYGSGARIHTNSWGGSSPDGYDAMAQQADQFAWDHKDMTILFSAGNDGSDANGDGVVDSRSIASPGTAKNIITVGMSESFRPSGGSNWPSGSGSWGSTWWPNPFPALPLSLDPWSNNVNGLGAPSGRGPTADGRFKPELVAPGTNIISARSHDPSFFPYVNNLVGRDYAYDSGTSMSAPHVAGIAALTRQWYIEQRGVPNPSSALLKATLINGADNIAPGQFGAGAYQEVPDTTPNNAAGWGRVNLARAVTPDAPLQSWFADQANGLSTGERITYTLHTASAAGAAPARAPAASLLSGGIELVQNGSFDAGSLEHWAVEGPVQATAEGHTGYGVQLTTGVDDYLNLLHQTLAFPTGVVSATLSFWVKVDSSETITYTTDYMHLGLTAGEDLTQLALPMGHLDAFGGSTSWRRVTLSFDAWTLAQVQGRSLYLVFRGATNDSGASVFTLDDISLRCELTRPTDPNPLRVTLAWTDYRGALGAGRKLVNDLDLEVIAPDGAHYYGNNSTAAQPDRLNNVETVWLPSVPVGTWQIVVHAQNVPQSTQPFAVVALGPGLSLGAAETPTPLPSSTPAATPTSTPKPSSTRTATASATPTCTLTPSATATTLPSPTTTASPSATLTPSVTASPTATVTPTPGPTVTPFDPVTAIYLPLCSRPPAIPPRQNGLDLPALLQASWR